MAEILRHLGNICYELNGGLGKMLNHTRLDRLSFWFWRKSFNREEVVRGRSFRNTNKGGKCN